MSRAEQCEMCERPADVQLFAAYSVDERRPHPTVARYPAPMARLCWSCLPDMVGADQATRAATAEYVIRPVDRPAEEGWTVYRE